MVTTANILKIVPMPLNRLKPTEIKISRVPSILSLRITGTMKTTVTITIYTITRAQNQNGWYEAKRARAMTLGLTERMSHSMSIPMLQSVFSAASSHKFLHAANP